MRLPWWLLERFRSSTRDQATLGGSRSAPIPSFFLLSITLAILTSSTGKDQDRQAEQAHQGAHRGQWKRSR